MTRNEAFAEINKTQDGYVHQLAEMIKSRLSWEGMKNFTENPDAALKEINFGSPTGTGKTKMMAKLANELGQDYYFIITTLSKSELPIQTERSLKKDTLYNNWEVYGNCSFTKNSNLTKEEILATFPRGRKIIWIRDEGHIENRNWQELLVNRVDLVVNFSATNKYLQGINCDFSDTEMRRTIEQLDGTPEDALEKLKDVKEQLQAVKNYNPCAILRATTPESEEECVEACKKLNLTYKKITNTRTNVQKLCKNNSDIDVIIQKYKMTEGIDIQRCHVLWMDNKPQDVATSIQFAGRSCRNALLYANPREIEMDIFAPENEDIYYNGKRAYLFYGIPGTRLETNDEGGFLLPFCDRVSCQKIKPGIIKVVDGKLDNGLKVVELLGCTGTYEISQDPETKFNIVAQADVNSTPVSFYDEQSLDSGENEEYEDSYLPFTKITNDRESAIIGVDKMKPSGIGTNWREETSIRSKAFDKSQKMRAFISQRYAKQISEATPSLFSKNGLVPQEGLPLKSHVAFSSAITYYSKYLTYGKAYINNEIKKVIEREGVSTAESFSSRMKNAILLKACLMKQDSLARHCFKKTISRTLDVLGFDDLLDDRYAEFIRRVTSYGEKANAFVKTKISQNYEIYDPNLSIDHIYGMPDYLSKDSIIIIKSSGDIQEKDLYILLGYHYLSTKRSDLNIKKGYIFDTITGKYIEVNF